MKVVPEKTYSVKEAARYLGVHRCTIYSYIRHLEKLYGGPLFEYNGKKPSPTRRGASSRSSSSFCREMGRSP